MLDIRPSCLNPIVWFSGRTMGLKKPPKVPPLVKPKGDKKKVSDKPQVGQSKKLVSVPATSCDVEVEPNNDDGDELDDAEPLCSDGSAHKQTKQGQRPRVAPEDEQLTKGGKIVCFLCGEVAAPRGENWKRTKPNVSGWVCPVGPFCHNCGTFGELSPWDLATLVGMCKDKSMQPQLKQWCEEFIENMGKDPKDIDYKDFVFFL